MQGKPLLVIVTGRPGAGKTTLAKVIAEEIRCPHISRDAIKEGMLLTLGMDSASDREVTHKVFEAFFANVELLLKSKISLVAEAAFQHKVWAPRLTELSEIADVRLLICTIAPDLAYARQLERNAQDPAFAIYHPLPDHHQGAAEPYTPPQLELPTLEVDTSGPPDMNSILSFLSR